MVTLILLRVSEPIENVMFIGYLFGALAAIIVFAYLIYTLLKPEKF
jgi:K+-transporting ATPase KdpF subunit